MSGEAEAAGSLLTAAGGEKPAASAAPADKPASDPAPAGGEGKDGEKGKDASGDKPKPGAPEKYEAFKLPEGLEVDQAMVDQFLPVAKELNLTQEQAQKLVDLQSSAMKAAAEAQTKAWDKTIEEWSNAARSDKEYGGPEFKANLATAKKAMDVFGNDALKAALDATGAGNHPELIRFMVKVGKAISEDKLMIGNAAAAPQEKSLAERLFPKHATQGA